jgi:hypothetical protein
MRWPCRVPIVCFALAFAAHGAAHRSESSFFFGATLVIAAAAVVAAFSSPGGRSRLGARVTLGAAGFGIVVAVCNSDRWLFFVHTTCGGSYVDPAPYFVLAATAAFAAVLAAFPLRLA